MRGELTRWYSADDEQKGDNEQRRGGGGAGTCLKIAHPSAIHDCLC